MQNQKMFAAEYSRNSDDLILFPRDTQYRKQLFPKLDLDAHPAKANIYLVQSIIEYVSEPGETIMDIMTGTGTIMVAALVGRNVVCIEIEDEYCRIIEEGMESLEAIAPGVSSAINLIPGDCAKVLPVYGINHIIFSPPYTNIMRKTGGKTGKMLDALSRETLGEGILNYSKSIDNVGNLNEFLYHQRMELIYKKTLESLEPGGTLTIIIKDHVEKQKRMFLGERAKKDCIKAGYELADHFKWLPPGTIYTSFMRARGDFVIDDEDIIILRRPL